MVVFAVWTGNVYSPKLLCLCRNLEHARQVAEDHDGWVNVGRWFRQVRLFLRRDPCVG